MKNPFPEVVGTRIRIAAIAGSLGAALGWSAWFVWTDRGNIPSNSAFPLTFWLAIPGVVGLFAGACSANRSVTQWPATIFAALICGAITGAIVAPFWT